MLNSVSICTHCTGYTATVACSRTERLQKSDVIIIYSLGLHIKILSIYCRMSYNEFHFYVLTQSVCNSTDNAHLCVLCSGAA